MCVENGVLPWAGDVLSVVPAKEHFGVPCIAFITLELEKYKGVAGPVSFIAHMESL